MVGPFYRRLHFLRSIGISPKLPIRPEHFVCCGYAELLKWKSRSTYRITTRQHRELTTKMPETRSAGPLVWVDCEMTGLDAENDSILSIACFITNSDLELLEDNGYEAIIHHDPEVLENMGEWCRHHHGSSGLTEAVLSSSTSARDAATGLLNYVKSHVDESGTAMLAGNSVHVDKGFLLKQPYSPVLDYLHYRILDVSTIKEAARRWSSKELLRNIPQKEKLHDARADILESIAEARYYKQVLFLPAAARQREV